MWKLFLCGVLSTPLLLPLPQWLTHLYSSVCVLIISGSTHQNDSCLPHLLSAELKEVVKGEFLLKSVKVSVKLIHVEEVKFSIFVNKFIGMQIYRQIDNRIIYGFLVDASYLWSMNCRTGPSSPWRKIGFQALHNYNWSGSETLCLLTSQWFNEPEGNSTSSVTNRENTHNGHQELTMNKGERDSWDDFGDKILGRLIKFVVIISMVQWDLLILSSRLQG